MNTNFDPNRPKLKKIKRPVNRTAPLGGTQNQQANMQQSSQTMQGPRFTQEPQQDFQRQKPQQAPQDFITTENLDKYLDGPANLPSISKQNQEYKPNYAGEDEYYDNQEVYSDIPAWLNTKIFVAAAVLCLAIGLLVGKLVFSQSTVVRNGLQGVVVNSEVPRGRARCGVAERSQGCVLYIMNPQKQEMSAKDFYDLASQMTGRQRFMIETGNMRYANSRIKPGDIAQLNIPPL